MTPIRELEKTLLNYIYNILPELAEKNEWSFKTSFSFCRIILDNVYQDYSLNQIIDIQDMSREKLEQAIVLAKMIEKKPRIINKLNKLSIKYRK
jgi:hypothetical protein